MQLKTAALNPTFKHHCHKLCSAIIPSAHLLAVRWSIVVQRELAGTYTLKAKSIQTNVATRAILQILDSRAINSAVAL